MMRLEDQEREEEDTAGGGDRRGRSMWAARFLWLRWKRSEGALAVTSFSATFRTLTMAFGQPRGKRHRRERKQGEEGETRMEATTARCGGGRRELLPCSVLQDLVFHLNVVPDLFAPVCHVNTLSRSDLETRFPQTSGLHPSDICLSIETSSNAQ
eukprot:759279-Hanusia_phi.AAC.2